MKRRGQLPKFIKCPRCGLKALEGTSTCSDCGLVFARLDLATNKDAKRLIKKGERDFVIKTNKLPCDVSFIKLLLLTFLLGFTGAHCYYVGRYARGILLTCNFIFVFLCVILNSVFIKLWGGNFLEIVGPIIGFFLLFWIYDCIMVPLKKFKVPVAIDLDTEVGQ